jgi:hypothetical protein
MAKKRRNVRKKVLFTNPPSFKRIRKPQPKKPVQVLLARLKPLKKAGIRVQFLELIPRDALSPKQGAKRFAELSTKEAPLLGEIAEAYAKIFKLGFLAESPGQETYYLAGGRETFCFTEFSKIRERITKGPMKKSLASAIRRFYANIEINDHKVRTFFAKKFRESLESELRSDVAYSAIRWAWT